MIRVFLVRHAPAVDRARGVPDSDRPLTRRGRDRFARAAKGLRKLDVRFDRMLHSPKRRAAQTAKLLLPLVRGRTVATAHLATAPSNALLRQMRGRLVAVVGHEPFLGELAAWLLTGRRAAAAHFAMKKGGVLVLEGEPRPGRMRLVACLPPKTLRQLGKG